MQQLCIRSYIDHGHEFHLCLGPTQGVPEGTIIKDANAFVSRERAKEISA